VTALSDIRTGGANSGATAGRVRGGGKDQYPGKPQSRDTLRGAGDSRPLSAAAGPGG